MKRILDSDNILMTILTKFGNLIILNFLFMIGCIPIVTIGASLSATLSVAMKIADSEENHITKYYVQSFKKNFLQATALWAIFVVAAMVLVGDFYYADHYTTGMLRSVLIGFSSFMAVVVIIIYSFAFPIQARYNNTVIKHLWNGFLIGIGNLLWMIVLWLVWIVPFATCYFYIWIFKYFGFIWFLCGFSTLFVISASIYLKVFRKINN